MFYPPPGISPFVISIFPVHSPLLAPKPVTSAGNFCLEYFYLPGLFNFPPSPNFSLSLSFPFNFPLFRFPQWGAVDAKIKVPSGENTELKRSPLKPGVGQYIAIRAMLTARDFFLAYFYPSGPPQWGAVDAEIKVPSGENTELKQSPFKARSRSVYSHTCHPYCNSCPASAFFFFF